jgi:hypothetical protein
VACGRLRELSGLRPVEKIEPLKTQLSQLSQLSQPSFAGAASLAPSVVRRMMLMVLAGIKIAAINGESSAWVAKYIPAML